MPRFLNPPTLPPPAGRYAQAVALGPPYKRLIVSAQIGMDASGRLAAGLEAQMAQAFDNVMAALAAAALGPEHLVRLACHVVPPDGVDLYRRLREERLGKHAPASTYIQVAGLADPAWLVTIEAEAVQEAGPQR